MMMVENRDWRLIGVVSEVWYNIATCSGSVTLKCPEPVDRAEVAELADALRSGRSGLTLIGVQIPASALSSLQGHDFVVVPNPGHT